LFGRKEGGSIDKGAGGGSFQILREIEGASKYFARGKIPTLPQGGEAGADAQCGRKHMLCEEGGGSPAIPRLPKGGKDETGLLLAPRRSGIILLEGEPAYCGEKEKEG